ncbi:MAG: hypothetical protein AB1697_09655 [Pseudomonadota bacterium]
MHRIDHATAAPGNLFTEGNPATATPATTVTDDWLNDMQENLAQLVEAASIALVKGDGTQVTDAIQALIAAAFAGYTTPPLFDNDTSLATTEFVQLAVGNLAGASYYTGAATLAASQAGRAIVGSGTFNLTLPAANTVPTGKGFYILSQAGTISVLRNGSDTINYGIVSGATSINLGSGDWMYVYSTGDNQWVVLAGTPLLTVGQTSGVFGSNATANGYQRLPSGILIQWMQFAKTTTTSPVSNSWPIAFPNALWNISGTIGGSVNPNGGAISASGNTTQVTIYTTSGQPGGTIMVIGIGN